MRPLPSYLLASHLSSTMARRMIISGRKFTMIDHLVLPICSYSYLLPSLESNVLSKKVCGYFSFVATCQFKVLETVQKM